MTYKAVASVDVDILDAIGIPPPTTEPFARPDRGRPPACSMRNR